MIYIGIGFAIIGLYIICNAVYNVYLQKPLGRDEGE